MSLFIFVSNTVQVQPWIPYNTFDYVFEFGCWYGLVYGSSLGFSRWFLPRDAFGQIEVFMDNGFNPIFLVHNLARSGQAMHVMFLNSRESLFGVYFGSGFVISNEYGCGPHGVQSWLELIKILRSNHICLGLIS